MIEKHSSWSFSLFYKNFEHSLMKVYLCTIPSVLIVFFKMLKNIFLWKRSRFYFWGSKITADDDCSHEIKRRLLLERKVITNLDSILKSRCITLPTKVCLVKAMVFPVVMNGCESWTTKKAECRRIDVFELCCWRRLLRVP